MGEVTPFRFHKVFAAIFVYFKKGFDKHNNTYRDFG